MTLPPRSFRDKEFLLHLRERLQEIYHCTRHMWGRARTIRCTRRIEQRSKALTDNPLSGMAREDLKPEGLRSFVHGNHVVFYQQ